MSQSFTYSMLFRAMAPEQSSGINNQSALLPVVAQSNADKLSYHKEGGGSVGWQLSSLPSTNVEKNEQSTRTEDLSQVLSFRHLVPDSSACRQRLPGPTTTATVHPPPMIPLSGVEVCGPDVCGVEVCGVDV